ncbi:PEST proteolytic signal-containing nuclear protein [Protopterus annectens]|uniref:PEST proteolytic signal-containing nuclear protein n=1 Tax=Protopterus annectens TaxID=7888 RepID=UPI001CFB2621|nr:PEST proteolytic signal-containing nuclear protein [Protopterus annectens]
MAEINDTVEKIQPVEGSEEKAEETVESKNVSSSNGEENTGSTAEKRSAEDTDANPAPAKVVKLGFSIGSLAVKKPPGISIKLGVTDSPPDEVPRKRKCKRRFITEGVTAERFIAEFDIVFKINQSFFYACDKYTSVKQIAETFSF